MKSSAKGTRIFKRKSINSEHDPYLSREAPEDLAKCRGCGLVYHDKRWYRSDDLPKGLLPRVKGELEHVLCPACLKIRDGYPEGFLMIEGEFAREHRDEIINLIRNKEERTSHQNPLERIIDIREKDGALEVTTTTEKFAQRIGQILEKTFHTQAEFKWSSDTKIGRVVWKREDHEK